jgi:hypothetical protein
MGNKSASRHRHHMLMTGESSEVTARSSGVDLRLADVINVDAVGSCHADKLRTWRESDLIGYTSSVNDVPSSLLPRENLILGVYRDRFYSNLVDHGVPDKKIFC